MPKLRIVQLHVPGYEHPFYARWPGSDLHIAYTILFRAEYNELTNMVCKSEPITALDIGANIGAAATFILQSFPNARVIAVEPDPGNAEICARNLMPFGNRAALRQAGLWSRNALLALETSTLAAGSEAGIQVREARAGDEAVVQGIDVPTLLTQANVNPAENPTIVMKIDAEGSEREIFRENAGWLRYISCIAIELHDYLPGHEGCNDIFFRAVDPYLAEPPRQCGGTFFVSLKPPQVSEAREND